MSGRIPTDARWPKKATRRAIEDRWRDDWRALGAILNGIGESSDSGLARAVGHRAAGWRLDGDWETYDAAILVAVGETFARSAAYHVRGFRPYGLQLVETMRAATHGLSAWRGLSARAELRELLRGDDK